MFWRKNETGLFYEMHNPPKAVTDPWIRVNFPPLLESLKAGGKGGFVKLVKTPFTHEAPCHSQANEFAVQMTKKVAAKVMDADRQLGEARMIIKDRALHPMRTVKKRRVI